MAALHYGSGDYLHKLFEKCNAVAEHCDGRTMKPKDLDIRTQVMLLRESDAWEILSNNFVDQKLKSKLKSELHRLDCRSEAIVESQLSAGLPLFSTVWQIEKLNRLLHGPETAEIYESEGYQHIDIRVLRCKLTESLLKLEECGKSLSNDEWDCVDDWI